jgi:hypothetical protein
MPKESFYVNFSENWNGKLDYPVFSTIRLHNERKLKRYYRNLFRPVVIKLNNQIYKRVRLVGLYTSSLSRMSADFIYFDCGLTREEFFNLMKKFYSQKIGWKEWETMMLVAFFLSFDDLKKWKKNKN